jgi:hypothetical protein
MRTGCSLSALLLLGLSVCACSTGPVSAKTSPQRAHQLVVLIDLSASRSIAMESDAKTFLHQLVDQLSFVDELVLLEVQESGLSDHPGLWKHKVTSTASQGVRQRASLDAGREYVTLPGTLKYGTFATRWLYSSR